MENRWMPAIKCIKTAFLSSAIEWKFHTVFHPTSECAIILLSFPWLGRLGWSESLPA